MAMSYKPELEDFSILKVHSNDPKKLNGMLKRTPKITAMFAKKGVSPKAETMDKPAKKLIVFANK
jgi:hypothetical protein